MFTMHYVLGCWYWLLKLTDTFVWLYSNKNNSKKPGGDIPWCSPSFLLSPCSDELDGFSWACVWRSCPPEWWWTGKTTDIDVKWGSGITVFFSFFFYGFWSARKHMVPVLSNALSSFLPSPCAAELPWPWVSCACLCGLWETESKKRAKGLSPDWISYYDVTQETRFFSCFYELCISPGGLARLTASLSHSHSLYFPRPIHVFRSHLFLFCKWRGSNYSQYVALWPFFFRYPQI